MKSDYKSIRNRMRENLNSEASKTEGTFSMDLINVFSNELARIISMEVDTIVDDVMLDTTTGINLDRKALELGEKRNHGEKAKGIVKIIGNTGIVIKQGTVLKSVYGVSYETIQDAVISPAGEAQVGVVCVQNGIEGNIKAGELKAFKDDLKGISSVINESEISGGTNTEEDEAFRQRVIEKKMRPIISGNKNHYVYWAKQVSGILKAKVIPLASGAGTVKVIVLSSEYAEVEGALLENVKKHIEDNRPVGAKVDVVSARAKDIRLNIRLRLEEHYEKDAVKEKISLKMKEYLKDIIFDERKSLSYYKVGDFVFTIEGVKDILDYTINGQKTSIEITEEEFFKLSEVIVDVG